MSETLKNDKRHLFAEYMQFMEISPVTLPAEVDSQFWHQYKQLKEREKVTWWGLVTKSVMVHLVSSLFTLSICPQFDYRLAHWASLEHIFMHWGEGWCSFWCGVLYTSVTALLLPMVLSTSEIKKIKPWFSLGMLLLCILSLFVLTVLGARPIWDTLTFLWILGAVCGSQVIFSGFTWLRARLTREVG